MDALEIIKKLKKKRPELAEEPLLVELEMSAEPMPEEGMEVAGMEPMKMNDSKKDTSYLEGVGNESAEGEMDADMLMADLDAEEGMDTPADALAPAEGSYLDDIEEEEDEEEMPVRKRRSREMA